MAGGVMSQDELPEDLVLTESQLREVIERAARISDRSEGISLIELREIARELDIEDDALFTALRAVLAGHDSPRSRRTPLGSLLIRLGQAVDWVLPRRHRWLAGAILGGTLGWYTEYASADVPVAIALIVLTLANSLSRRLTGRRARFLAETIATWIAFAAVWSSTYGQVTDDLLRGVLVCLTGFGIWAWLVIRPRRNKGQALERARSGETTLPRPRPDPGNETALRLRAAW
jgi:hypothetical protein